MLTTTHRPYRGTDLIRRSTRGVVLAAIFTGCGAEPSNTTFGAALAQNSCGPADGPAVEIQLALAPATELSARPSLQVMIYRARADAAGRSWQINTSFDSAAGSFCPATGDCESATSGTVRLDPTTSVNAVSGTVEARFPIKGIVRGRFQAEWRERNILCG
ncbi:MAG: hypothetical protein ACKVZ0_14755 [Gemmatimonadales bacterium]